MNRKSISKTMERLLILLMFLNFSILSCTPAARRPTYTNPPIPDRFEHVIQHIYEDMTCQAFNLPLRNTLGNKPWNFQTSEIQDDSLRTFTVKTGFSENEVNMNDFKPGAVGIWAFRFSCIEREGVAEVEVEYCALWAPFTEKKWSPECSIDQQVARHAIATAEKILDRAREAIRRLDDAL
jgi:hypothetical protein